MVFDAIDDIVNQFHGDDDCTSGIVLSSDDFIIICDAFLNYSFILQSLLPVVQDENTCSALACHIDRSREILEKLQSITPDCIVPE